MHEHPRRHERKTMAMAVELRIFLEDGKHFDCGTAVVRNVSLSGALLGALVLPRNAIPIRPCMLGISALQRPLKDVEILGRPVRLVHGKAGVEIATEFFALEELELTRLRRIVRAG